MGRVRCSSLCYSALPLALPGEFVLLPPTTALESGLDSAGSPGILGSGEPAVLASDGQIQTVRLLWEWDKCCTELFLVCTHLWKVLGTDVGSGIFLRFDLFAWIRDICIKNENIKLQLVWIQVKSSCWWHERFASCSYMWKTWNLLSVIQK